jgi:hypothetical protein
MGAHPYWYYVNYESDTNKALQDLREREFKAGRYNPVIRFINFPLDTNSPTPGAKHTSIAAAMKASEDSGTRSILDIEKIARIADYCTATPLDNSVLQSLYGTTQPTHEMVENNLDFLEDIQRGQCVYFTIYKDGKADELLFAGYSFD